MESAEASEAGLEGEAMGESWVSGFPGRVMQVVVTAIPFVTITVGQNSWSSISTYATTSSMPYSHSLGLCPSTRIAAIPTASPTSTGLFLIISIT